MIVEADLNCGDQNINAHAERKKKQEIIESRSRVR